MIVESDYRGWRIEVEAVAENGRYQGDVRMRRLFSQEKPRHEVVTCYKLTPDGADHTRHSCGRKGGLTPTASRARERCRRPSTTGRQESTLPHDAVGSRRCDECVPSEPSGVRRLRAVSLRV